MPSLCRLGLVIRLRTRLLIRLCVCCWLPILCGYLLVILDTLKSGRYILLWYWILYISLSNLRPPFHPFHVFSSRPLCWPQFKLNVSTCNPFLEISNHFNLINLICLFLFVNCLGHHSCYLLYVIVEISQLYRLWYLLDCLKLRIFCEDILILWQVFCYPVYFLVEWRHDIFMYQTNYYVFKKYKPYLIKCVWKYNFMFIFFMCKICVYQIPF